MCIQVLRTYSILGSAVHIHPDRYTDWWNPQQFFCPSQVFFQLHLLLLSSPYYHNSTFNHSHLSRVCFCYSYFLPLSIESLAFHLFSGLLRPLSQHCLLQCTHLHQNSRSTIRDLPYFLSPRFRPRFDLTPTTISSNISLTHSTLQLDTSHKRGGSSSRLQLVPSSCSTDRPPV